MYLILHLAAGKLLLTLYRQALQLVVKKVSVVKPLLLLPLAVIKMCSINQTMCKVVAFVWAPPCLALGHNFTIPNDQHKKPL